MQLLTNKISSKNLKQLSAGLKTFGSTTKTKFVSRGFSGEKPKTKLSATFIDKIRNADGNRGNQDDSSQGDKKGFKHVVGKFCL